MSVNSVIYNPELDILALVEAVLDKYIMAVYCSDGKYREGIIISKDKENQWVILGSL